MKNQKKAYIFAILSVLFWSTVSTAYKLSLRELDFMQVLFISTGVSAIIAFVYLLINRKISLLFQSTKKELISSAVLALLNPFGYYLVLLKAYSILPAQVAQPLNYIWPVVLVLLSAPILKQKINFIAIIAMLISFSGVLIISTQGKLASLHIDEPLGVILALSSSIFWAFFWLLNVKDKRDEVVKLFFNFVFALAYEAIIVSVFSDFRFSIDKAFAAAIYVGTFDMGITFILWMKALKYTERTDKISNLIYFSPVLALFFIHFILAEKIFYTTYIGLLLILSGVILINKKQQR